MLNGWKTYIVIALMAVYNILVHMGYLTGISEGDWQTFVNVVLAILGIIFNGVGRAGVAKTGRTFNY